MNGGLIAEDDDVVVLDPDYTPDEVAAWAATAAPWDAIATPVGELDPARLSPAGRVDLLVALDRHRAWIDAQQQRLLALMASDPGSGPVPELDRQWVREEVACALRVSAPTAAAKLHLATELVDRLPDTLAALHHGDLSLLHARALAEAVLTLDDESATQVEARVLPRAVTQTLGQFHRSLRRAVLAVDPRGSEQKHTDAAAQRRVVLTPQDNGMSELWALLPADRASALWTALNAAAGRSCPDDDRTADQRRADTLVDRICHPDTNIGTTSRTMSGTDAGAGTDTAAGPDAQEGAGRPGRHGGLRPLVQVTVALSTLLGLDEQPAELAGHGPVPAVLARHIAADPTGTWRRLVTDPTGHLLDYGRTHYRPPVALADHVVADAGTCRFPTCQRPAATAELDHIRAWTDGGETNPENLQPLCSRDHHGKHEGGWSVTPHPDGSTDWTSRTGHTYRTPPPDPLPLDHTSDPPPF